MKLKSYIDLLHLFAISYCQNELIDRTKSEDFKFIIEWLV